MRENAEMLSRLGKKVYTAAVEPHGAVSPRTLREALDRAENPRMAACMGVNNETGTVTDLAAITAMLRERGGTVPHLHSDLVQQIGKVPLGIPLAELDSAAISAHKIGGPRGIGILYVRKSLEAFTRGGGQERGLRPGTENVAGAYALAACLEKYAAPETLREQYAGAAARGNALISALAETGRCTLIPAGRTADDPRFSPWIFQLAFDGIPGEVMVRALDAAGVAVSTGSACSSRKKERPVLDAMGVSAKTAFEGIRISQGWSTTMSGGRRGHRAAMRYAEYVDKWPGIPHT